MTTRPPLPPVKVPHPHITTVDASGNQVSPVIRGTLILVRRLFSWHRQGTTFETLSRRYPSVGPAPLLDALAFAYDNLELITADLTREREELAESLRANPHDEEPHR